MECLNAVSWELCRKHQCLQEAGRVVPQHATNNNNNNAVFIIKIKLKLKLKLICDQFSQQQLCKGPAGCFFSTFFTINIKFY
jgi:hypothetical protein